jgi:hypothetical protein
MWGGLQLHPADSSLLRDITLKYYSIKIAKPIDSVRVASYHQAGKYKQGYA